MSAARLALFVVGIAAVCLGPTGCVARVGTQKSSPTATYNQTHQNAVSGSRPSLETVTVLHRFDQVSQFAKAPDLTLHLIHQKAMESRDRGLLYALAELSYLAGEQLRRSVKPWEMRDARDYYLASAVYAWFFLFGDAAGPPPTAFDERFRTACDFYNRGLSWALTTRRGTNAVAVLAGGTRHFPTGRLDLDFTDESFGRSLEDFERFIVADQFLVRGLSARNRQPGLGAPLVGITRLDPKLQLARCVPATVFLRLKTELADLAQGRCHGALELYSPFETNAVQVGAHSVPLETDTTIALASALNNSLLWRLGMLQFLSAEERVPTDVYLTQPYTPGKVPVALIHGTFSSPVHWAEMANSLYADLEIRKRCQIWVYTYNSGNPIAYSAVKLREALQAKLRELDPQGEDAAAHQMVLIGHSQGGLLAKLTATDTGDALLKTVLNTNRVQLPRLTGEHQALLRRFTCFEPLPFVKRVIFISTPHRGSYLATHFVRSFARRFVSLPSLVVSSSMGFVGLAEKLGMPEEAKVARTSLDSMSPRNPVLLTLADLPLAPGVKGHSIISVNGAGDFHKGKDGLVAYSSAHVDYVESEFIVRGSHSCQSLPATIEEVRRILLEHLASLPPPEPQSASLH